MYLSVFGFFLYLCYQNPPLSTPRPSYQAQRYVLPSSDLWNQIHDFFHVFFLFTSEAAGIFLAGFRLDPQHPLLCSDFGSRHFFYWFWRLDSSVCCERRSKKIKVSLHERTCECLRKAARARAWKSLVVDLALPRFIAARSTRACAWRCITLSASGQEVFNNLWKIIKPVEGVRGVV